MKGWLQICLGLALLAFGIVNIYALPWRATDAHALLRFGVIFHGVLFVVPGILEIKSGVFAVLAPFKRASPQGDVPGMGVVPASGHGGVAGGSP